MTMWAAVDRAVDTVTDPVALYAHGLDLWAAKRWSEAGRVVPEQFLEHERAATMAVLTIPSLLKWVRDVLDGPVLLMKGPEVAARYPDPSRRPFGDLDLLVQDPDEAQRRLIAAGCIEVTAASPHHRPELQAPGSMLLIEVHERPKWPSWTRGDVQELFESAVPSVTGIDGIQTVHPAHHALLLAAHSWQHEPLRRVIDLVDVAAMMHGTDPAEIQRLAERWRLGRVWRATDRAIEAFQTGEPPRHLAERLVGRHVWEMRERTPFGQHVANWVHGYWAPTPALAVRTMVETIVRDAMPIDEESLGEKIDHSLRLIGASYRRASERRSA
jgi:hypothetical protein